MDIRVLKYFLAVAQEGNITRAAEVLQMTQPPLSRQLKDLEEEIGKPLLIRGSKQVTLTEDGLLLKKRAEELVALLDKTEAELKATDEATAGDVYIACAETDAVALLAQVAEAVQRAHPLVHYQLHSGDASIVCEKLDRGLVDFGLVIGPVDEDKYHAIRLPGDDVWGVLMPAGHPLAAQAAVCASDLAGAPLILSHQGSVSSALVTWLHADEAPPRVVLRYDLIYNASHFVARGLGLAIVLDNLIDTRPDSGLAFRPLAPLVTAERHLIWKKHQVFSRASREFLRQLRATLNPE
ncbi:MAG: LysR family transcriptional regulator [Peptococcaceae bacterium]|nr:LysR family transcriptional regulator [Peptococcaceae bacterium]